MPGPRLLIVEDDTAIADLIADALGDEGYEVDRVLSPDAAITLLDERGSDAYCGVLSSTFVHPSDDPYLQLDRIRQHTTVPIIICSGFPAARYAGYRARGYAAFLQEPFDLQDLIDTVTGVCRVSL